MLNINPNSLDSCTAIIIACVSVLHVYVGTEDFLGIEHHYGIHLPPVADWASVLLLILTFWILCKFANRAAFGQSNR